MEHKPIRRVAGVIYRRESGGIAYLLIQGEKGGWIFPQGHVEPGETDEEAVLRECEEEAGAVCVMDRSLGMFLDPVGTRVYLLRYRSMLDGPEDPRVRWFSFEEAIQVLAYRDGRALLTRAHALLEQKQEA